MGYYNSALLPRAIALACGSRHFSSWRTEATQGLAGRVIEVGFGSGANVAYYPDAVDSLVALEPSDLARRLAGRALKRTSVKVALSAAVGEKIPFDSASFDAALATFVLCTVADPQAVLSELRRVLVPGGTLHFLEHGISGDPKVSKWQNRLDPLETRLAGGCHLTRDAASLISDAGFQVTSLRKGYGPGPRPWSYFSVGTALNPRPAP